jgi:ketosteroid isomerase-like protein
MPGILVDVTAAELLARLRATLDTTGELDWSLVRPDFEIQDHELLDSAVHRGPDGWREWRRDWQEAFEDYSLERLEQVEIDDRRTLTVFRLRARGRASGVQLERTDAQLWTFSGDRLARMDYYPDYRANQQPWSERDIGDRQVEIVRSALEAFRRGEVDVALKHIHPDMVSRRIEPDGAVFHGRDGLMALMADWVEGFEEWSYRGEEFIDAGDHVVVRLHQWGRGAGSGAMVDGDFWLTYAFEDGKVTRFTIFSDRQAAFEEAGVSGS